MLIELKKLKSRDGVNMFGEPACILEVLPEPDCPRADMIAAGKQDCCARHSMCPGTPPMLEEGCAHFYAVVGGAYCARLKEATCD